MFPRANCRAKIVWPLRPNLFLLIFAFPGNRRDMVAALFRAIGAHYLDHFTLTILHGLCLEFGKPKWELKVGSLYPVKKARKIKFTQYSLNMKKMKEMKPLGFSEAQGRFCSTEFPEAYKSFEKAVREDPLNIEDIISKANNSKTQIGVPSAPKFERDEEFTAGYCFDSKEGRLKTIPSKVDKRLKKFKIKAVNLDGCLLSSLAKYGRRNNVSVVLAINDICDAHGSLVLHLPEAMMKIITYFVRAVIVAGLPEGESFGTAEAITNP